MRCLSCNKILSDYESTRKYKETKTFIDLCNTCFSSSDLNISDVSDRTDLKYINDEKELESDDF
jgi:hypothetical protein